MPSARRWFSRCPRRLNHHNEGGLPAVVSLSFVLAATITPSFIIQEVIAGLTIGAIYALIALGYTMVYGIIELINFAHGDVFMIGSFVAIVVLNLLGISGPLVGWDLIGTLLLLFAVCMGFCGLLGVVIERVAYRPLRNAPRLAPLISAIGVSLILENV